MKNLTAVILMFSLLSFQFSELLIFVSFKINQEYIAKNHCVERDVEGSTCKGCCQLKKRMNEQQESKKALPPVQTEKQNIDFWNQPAFSWKFYYPKSNKFIIIRANYYIFLLAECIFHPPKYL